MLSKPNLYVLGGNPTISELLRRQSQRLKDFNIVIVDSRKAAPAHQFADQSVYEDPRQFVTRHKFSDDSKVLPTASDISAEAFIIYSRRENQQNFDVTGWDKLLDKTTMVQHLDAPEKQNRLLFSTAAGDREVLELLNDYPNLNKFVVKPNKASGGRGFKVVQRGEDLELALRSAASQSADKQAVLEAYVNIAHQFCGDIYVQNGSIETCFIGDGIWSRSQETGFPLGEIFPTRRPDQISQVISQIMRLLVKLKIEEGIFNFDAIIDEAREVRVIELAPRPGGNHLSYAASLAAEVDFEQLYLKYYLGLEMIPKPSPSYKTVIVTMVRAKKLSLTQQLNPPLQPNFKLFVPYVSKMPTRDKSSMSYVGSTITAFLENLEFEECTGYRDFSEIEFLNSNEYV